VLTQAPLFFVFCGIIALVGSRIQEQHVTIPGF